MVENDNVAAVVDEIVDSVLDANNGEAGGSADGTENDADDADVADGSGATRKGFANGYEEHGVAC